jgi:hypothetical protein
MKVRCQNCERIYDSDDITPLGDTPDLLERIEPGELVPAGECPDPECKALCHVVFDSSRTLIDNLSDPDIRSAFKRDFLLEKANLPALMFALEGALSLAERGAVTKAEKSLITTVRTMVPSTQAPVVVEGTETSSEEAEALKASGDVDDNDADEDEDDEDEEES